MQCLSGAILLNYFLISSPSSFFTVGPLFAHQSANPVSVCVTGILQRDNEGSRDVISILHASKARGMMLQEEKRVVNG